MVEIHLTQKTSPLVSWATIVQKEMRTVLVRRILPFPGPRIMRHYFGKRDLVFIH